MSVTVREKKIKGGKKSLYLDFYPAIINPNTGKETRREFLGIYIHEKPKDEIEKEYNREKNAIAQAIRGQREISILNNEYGFIDKTKGKTDFLEYFKKYAEKKDDQNWLLSYRHFHNFTNGFCTVSQVNETLCREFREYILKANNLNSKVEKKVATNTAVAYFGKFRALLKQAFREKLLSENINDRLDGIKPEETNREFLTLDELQLLSDTPCEIPVLKNAALFSALTSLRFSDIEKLTWGEVQHSNLTGYYIRFRQKKTKGHETLPISDEAYELLGAPASQNDEVFRGFSYSMTQIYLKRWVLKAGIIRNITFHSFRHTFATLQLTLGTDIYTVSKMLGHKKLETTQIYAKIVDAKKREASNRIKLKR